MIIAEKGDVSRLNKINKIQNSNIDSLNDILKANDQKLINHEAHMKDEVYPSIEKQKPELEECFNNYNINATDEGFSLLKVLKKVLLLN